MPVYNATVYVLSTVCCLLCHTVYCATLSAVYCTTRPLFTVPHHRDTVSSRHCVIETLCHRAARVCQGPVLEMGADTLPDLESIPVRHETLEELGMQSIPTGVSKMGLKKKHLLIQELLRNEEVNAPLCMFLSLCLCSITPTLPHSHSPTQCLSLVLVVMIKPKELKTKISLNHSLILSHCFRVSLTPLAICSVLTHCVSNSSSQDLLC